MEKLEVVKLSDFAPFAEAFNADINEWYDSKCHMIKFTVKHAKYRWLLQNLAEIFSHWGLIVGTGCDNSIEYISIETTAVA